VDIPGGPADGRGLIQSPPSQEPARRGCSLREASCVRARHRIAGLLRGKQNWLRCATIPGPSRPTRLPFTGNRASRTGTTSSTRRSSSIGWIWISRAPRVSMPWRISQPRMPQWTCWDAKYTYWAIRPFMLGVTPLFATPNHPSHPAAHGCYSGSISAVLAYLFPHDAIDLNALGNEAGRVAALARYLLSQRHRCGIGSGSRGCQARN